MEKENGNVLNLSPYKIDSIRRALKGDGSPNGSDLNVYNNLDKTEANTLATANNTATIVTNTATIASNTATTNSRLSTVISNQEKIIALLQQLVDK